MDPREPPSVEIQNHSVIQGSNPSDYLVLRYIASSDLPHGGQDFYELVWRRQNGDEWEGMARMGAARFQEGSLYQRWISDVHSFDSQTMTAIVKVGEADALMGSHTTHYNYSWRELSLRGDDALKILHACESPFEPYQPSSAQA